VETKPGYLAASKAFPKRLVYGLEVVVLNALRFVAIIAAFVRVLL